MKPPLLLWLFAAATGFLLAADSAAPAADATQPTVITSVRGKIVNGEAETLITYDQAVTVTGTNLRITCDHLEVVLVRLGDKSETLSKLDKFKSLVATGHVHIVQGDREASCGHAEILPGEDKIVLTEEPVVTYHDEVNPWVAAGDRITMFKGKREVDVENPRTTLPSVKNLGLDPTKVLPPAATPATKQP